MTHSESTAAASPTPSPFYWSVQREVWENRSIYMAPIAIACVVLFGSLVNASTLPHRLPALLNGSAASQRAAVVTPFNVAAGLTMFTAFIVGCFYSVDAFYGERRDRSILFWKSLPVSDRTTVLSKAAIPLVVLPVIVYPLIFATQLAILLLDAMVLAGTPGGLAMLWTHVKFVQFLIAGLYAVIAITLWYAPIYCWLQFVSAWAKRTPILWAVLPGAALAMFEQVAFGTKVISAFFAYRMTGWYSRAFVPYVKGSPRLDPIAAMTPLKFFGSPGLWLGLIVAAALIAMTIRLRHYREPL
jgi:ABC-2 type transport system permease protein